MICARGAPKVGSCGSRYLDGGVAEYVCVIV